MKTDLHSKVDAMFADLAGRAVPGLAVGVLHGGEVLLNKGYGLASLSQLTPIRADTRFRIASVSKQFTVAAALLLERRGLLSQDDDVQAHVPELAALPERVTVGHLMRNTSGLPDMLELLRLGGVNLDQRVDRAGLLAAMARNSHLNFAPGSRFLYCNSGFALLGEIVERISGQSLDALLQTEFFGPLGMGSTRMLVESDVPLPGLASPYLPAPGSDGGWRRAQHGFEHGGEGGLVSSVPDLLLWAAHLLQPTPGVADMADALGARVALNQGADSPYAYGLEHSRLDELAALGHGGLWPGYRTEFLLLPEANLAVVVISNDGAQNPYKIARDIARVVLDRPAPVPASYPDDAAALVGSWLNAEQGQFFELSLQSGRLMAQQWGASFELQPEADGRWLPLRGAYEFELQGLQQDGRLRLGIGAGRSVDCRRVTSRATLPPRLAGDYWCEDIATLWRIQAHPQGLRVWVEGPQMKVQQAWTLHGLDDQLCELRGAGYWAPTHLLLRAAQGSEQTVSHLIVDSARIKGLRFKRHNAL
ncbi:serine hydrolase [Paucibacter sp. PLA-PC-4]|uniref:serine hydrolase domain-containing protein n=1 Tax=Paucibacter sp. PLA-PC-4 TaxID=2993655 RepID=UPI0022494608|nr:serine hydrolase domain-containing protein [Paucibacter sp. PLA-PC-4]MCX2860898.1 serine hydrolase [Paucibacter sp. PLA-PC-4]